MGRIPSRALWHCNASNSEIRDMILDQKEGTRQIQSTYSLISLGTELLIANGLIPEHQASRMAVPYMAGDMTLPLKYGYSLVGKDMESGEAFHLMHPHQSFCTVSQGDLYRIPDNVPHKRATLASNMETAVNAVWDSRITKGSTILLVGFGMIGSLIARVARSMVQADILVAETHPVRAEYAKTLGFTVTSDIQEGHFAVAFHTSATETGLQQCIDAVGMEGTVVELSWYGSRKVNIALGGSFHFGRKRIISSQVSHIPLYRQPEWNFEKRKALVFDLLSDPMFDQHLTNEVTLDEAAQLFNEWRTQPPTGLGYVVKY